MPPVAALRPLLEDFVEALKPKAPIPARRPKLPQLRTYVGQEMMLGTLQTSILWHRVE